VPTPKLKPLRQQSPLLDPMAFAEGVAGVTPNWMFPTEFGRPPALTSFGHHVIELSLDEGLIAAGPAP